MIAQKFRSKIDLSFNYTPAAYTDIRKTIQREKERIQKLKDELEVKKVFTKAL